MNTRREDIPCPQAGGGVHHWLLGRANQLRSRNLTPNTAASVLAEESRGCGRRVAAREIADAVSVAFDRQGTNQFQSGTGFRSKPAWPELDEKLIADIEASGCGLADLWEASPIRIEDSDSHTERIIDALFPGNPLLCCGRTQYDFETKPREQWRGSLAELQFIVPSPMSAPTGQTQDGRESAHCLANTGPRRFLVFEFDSGSVDQHAARLLWFSDRAPLALVVHSGGKSLHGWFYCQGQDEAKLRRAMRKAVSIAADPATWTRSQFVRMPDGTRENGRRQTVYYFAPEVIR